jgi:hypothetical protein
MLALGRCFDAASLEQFLCEADGDDLRDAAIPTKSGRQRLRSDRRGILGHVVIEQAAKRQVLQSPPVRRNGHAELAVFASLIAGTAK